MLLAYILESTDTSRSLKYLS